MTEDSTTSFEATEEATRLFNHYFSREVLQPNPYVAMPLADSQYSSDGELTALALNSQGNPFNLDDIPVQPFHLPYEDCAVSAESHEAKPSIETMNMASSEAMAGNLSTVNFPGELQFDVTIKNAVNNKDPQFSDKLGKLYINQNKGVQVFFRLVPKQDPCLYIRAVAVYLGPDHISTPVTVCPTHSRKSEGELKSPHAEHLIKCFAGEKDTGRYLQDNVSGRHCVLMAVPLMAAGSNEVFFTYKFSDLGSCPGGINRREIAVVFTLENERYEVLGRKVLPVRICTSPKRDMNNEEQHFDRKNGLSSSGVDQTLGDKSASTGKRKAYWVLAYGKDNYDALRGLGELLEKKDTGRVQEYKDFVESFNNEETFAKKSKRENK